MDEELSKKGCDEDCRPDKYPLFEHLVISGIEVNCFLFVYLVQFKYPSQGLLDITCLLQLPVYLLAGVPVYPIP
jgi:hypothetical protein